MLGAEDVKKIQQENQTTTVETQIESSSNQETSAGSNVDFVIPQQIASLKVAELFGLSTTELQQYDIEIKRLLDYVDTFNPKSLDDIIFHIKHLDAQIGTTMGENKLKTLSRYLFLNREKDYLERQMERMKGL